MRPPRDAEEREYAVLAWRMGGRYVIQGGSENNLGAIPQPVEHPNLSAMESPFRVGDVVRLHSHHVPMTVSEDWPGTGRVQCTWFEPLHGALHRAEFDVGALRFIRRDGITEPEAMPTDKVTEPHRATEEKRPTLAPGWFTMDRTGETIQLPTRAEAVEFAEQMDREYPRSAPHRVVRLAVVEVVEPEPEVAPSGWRYELGPGPAHGRTMIWIGDGVWMISTAADTMNVTRNVPPIDRDFVSALLAKAGT